MKEKIQVHQELVSVLAPRALAYYSKFMEWTKAIPEEEYIKKYRNNATRKNAACLELEDFIKYSNISLQEAAELQYAFTNLKDQVEHFETHLTKMVMSKADVEFIERDNPLHKSRRN